MTLENAPTCVFALITGLLLFNAYMGVRGMKLPALHDLQHRNMRRANRCGDLAQRVARSVSGEDRRTVLAYGGSTTFRRPPCAGEGTHLGEQRVGAVQQGVGFAHAPSVLQPQCLINQAVGLGHGVAGGEGVDVLLGAGVQRVGGGVLDLHAGNMTYRRMFVKSLFNVYMGARK